MSERRLFRPKGNAWKRLLRKGKKALLVCLFSFLTAAMLLENEKALELSKAGLNLWFQNMIPTLLPFMILSGILIRMNLSDRFASLFSPLLRPLFGLSDSCLYVLVIGFLCGFPMGARVTAESYERGRLSKREATLMLSFCNNIGPIYFTGFVLPLFHRTKPLPFLAGMYLLPFIYGLLLRYTVYRDIPLYSAKNAGPQKETAHIHAASLPESSCREPSLLAATQSSILSGLSAITSLGGYMILFNLMNLVPDLLLPSGYASLRSFFGCMLEITSGLSRLSASEAFLGFVLLPFGGLSCIAQTYSMIQDTDLSLKTYLFHKCALTAITFCYYAVIWPAVYP